MNACDTIYEEAKKLGVEIDHHESDLYIPVTPETQELVRNYQFRSIVTRFTSQVDGKSWYDIPFAYQPFWNAVERRIEKSLNRTVT
jgi:hypothetical protein